MLFLGILVLSVWLKIEGKGGNVGVETVKVSSENEKTMVRDDEDFIEARKQKKMGLGQNMQNVQRKFVNQNLFLGLKLNKLWIKTRWTLTIM